ncbi:MAG: fibronectin type III domain-containing protein [Burkholderiales bacterium]|nr:fibronectin type III domain-containing protein [Phycisphaerae bacterium]
MKNTASVLARAVRPLVESLETRQLLSASLDSTSRLLTVTGTSDADTISVLRVGTDYKVVVSDLADSIVSLFPSTDVDSIVINALGGNDKVTISSAIVDNTTVDAGTGAGDTLSIVGTTSADLVVIGSVDGGGSLVDAGVIALTESGITASIEGFEAYRFDGRVSGVVLDSLHVNSPVKVVLAGSQAFQSLNFTGSAAGEIAVGPASLVSTKSFDLGSLGKFNVNSNVLLIDYSATPTSSPYTYMVDKLRHGLTYLGGDGLGVGLQTEFVTAVQGTTLGVVDNGLIGGQITEMGTFKNIPNKAVIVSYTWFGDANLDGRVNGSDYALTDTGLSSGHDDWFYGDFNIDLVVNGSDYAFADTGFSSQFVGAIGIYNAAPSSIYVQPLWEGAARVSWRGSASKYIVFASMDEGDYVQVAEVSGATHYDFRSPIAGQVRFRVAAVYASGTATQQHISTSRTREALHPVTKLEWAEQIAEDDGSDHTGYPYPSPPAAGEPDAPTALAAAAYLNTQRIDLTWTDNSNNETGFVVLRGENGSSFAEIATVAAGVTTFYDNTAAGGKTYYYRVIARNAMGDSAPSNTSSALAILKRPVGLYPEIVNWSTIDLNWTDPNPYEAGYVIESYDFINEEWLPLATTPANTQSYRVTGLTAQTDYQFRIKAVGERDSLFRASAVVTTPAWGHGDLPAAEELNIESIDGNTVRLTWTDNASDESGYSLRYRVVNGDGTFGEWVTVTIGANGDGSGSFDLGGLESETEYEFELIPLDPDAGGGGGGSGGGPSQSANFTTGVQAGRIGVFGLDHPELTPPYISVDWTPMEDTTYPNGQTVEYYKTAELHDETVTIIFTGLKTHRYIDLGLLLNADEDSYVRPEGASHGQLAIKVDGTEVPMEGSFSEPGWNRPLFYESWSPVEGENIIPHTDDTLTLTITGANYSRASHAWWIQSFWLSTIMPSVSVLDGSEVMEGDTQKLVYTVTRNMYGAERFPLVAPLEWFVAPSTASGNDLKIAPPTTVSFEAGETTRHIEIGVAVDRKLEGMENLAVQVQPSEDYLIGQKKALGFIYDQPVRLQISTFIKQYLVEDPGRFDSIFQGDGRGGLTGNGPAEFDEENTRFKTRQIADLEFVVDPNEPSAGNLLLVPSSISAQTGISVRYNASTSTVGHSGLPIFDPWVTISQAAMDDDILDDDVLKVDVGQAGTGGMTMSTRSIDSRTIEITIVGEAGNPLAVAAPAINYDLVLTIQVNADGYLNWWIEGAHDGFPCYEVYLYHELIYQHDSADQTPLSLGPPEEFGVSASGTIF